MFLKSVFCFTHVSVFVTIPHCRPHFSSSVTVDSPTGAFLFFGEQTHVSLPQGICAVCLECCSFLPLFGWWFLLIPCLSAPRSPSRKALLWTLSLKRAPKNLHIPLVSYCILGYPKTIMWVCLLILPLPGTCARSSHDPMCPIHLPCSLCSVQWVVLTLKKWERNVSLFHIQDECVFSPWLLEGDLTWVHSHRSQSRKPPRVVFMCF